MGLWRVKFETVFKQKQKAALLYYMPAFKRQRNSESFTQCVLIKSAPLGMLGRMWRDL